MKLGLIGCGRQGARYLLDSNGGAAFAGGVVYGRSNVVCGPWRAATNEYDAITSVDAVVIASPPATHEKLATWCLEAGKPVLIEKPLALDFAACERLLDASRRLGVPLMVAHTHLWARGFRKLEPSPWASVVWAGPERDDESCPAELDWGPHAFSMGIALGTKTIGTARRYERITCAWSNGESYLGETEPGESPMREMMGTFFRVCQGGADWRAHTGFTWDVYRDLFASTARATPTETVA